MTAQVRVQRGYKPLELRIPMAEARYIAENCKPTTLAVYIALYTYADNSTHDCYPSYEGIMKRANVGSKTTVNNALKELEGLGAITKQVRAGNRKKDPQTTIYTLNEFVQNMDKDEKGQSKICTTPSTESVRKLAPHELAPEKTTSSDVVNEQSSSPPSSVASDDEKKRLNKIAYGIFAAWCDIVGMDPNTVVNRRSEMAHATKLATEGQMLPEYMPEFFEWCMNLEWRKSPVTLRFMVSQANTYRLARAERANKPVNKRNKFVPG